MRGIIADPAGTFAPMDGARALEEQLGGALPPGLEDALTDADLARLAQAIRVRRLAQADALTEAGEAGLRFVPALLRGPVKKIVGIR
jgi:hypothetical protein